MKPVLRIEPNKCKEYILQIDNSNILNIYKLNKFIRMEKIILQYPKKYIKEYLKIHLLLLRHINFYMSKVYKP